MASLGPVQATLVTLGSGLEPPYRSAKSSVESLVIADFSHVFPWEIPVGLAVDPELARDEAHLRRDWGTLSGIHETIDSEL